SRPARRGDRRSRTGRSRGSAARRAIGDGPRGPVRGWPAPRDILRAPPVRARRRCPRSHRWRRRTAHRDRRTTGHRQGPQRAGPARSGYGEKAIAAASNFPSPLVALMPRTGAARKRRQSGGPAREKGGASRHRPRRPGERREFRTRSRLSPGWRLLELDGTAGFLDLLLDLFGLGLVDAFLERLRRALDEGLGFGQAQAGDGADFLDHLDLLAAVTGQDDVELGLLLGGGAGITTTSGGGGNGDGSGGGSAPRDRKSTRLHA